MKKKIDINFYVFLAHAHAVLHAMLHSNSCFQSICPKSLNNLCCNSVTHRVVWDNIQNSGVCYVRTMTACIITNKCDRTT